MRIKLEHIDSAVSGDPGPRLTPEKQLAGFLAKYEARVARLARQTRALLRKQLPTALELVYDNYQFLAIGFCATDRTR